MKLDQGQHIKCVFRNSMVVEGIIESWSKDEAVLNSLDGTNVLIIMRPGDDIMLIKLVLKTQKINVTELENKFEETLEQPSDTPDRIENLAELRLRLADAEQQIVSQKLKEHHIGVPKLTQYASPYTPGKLPFKIAPLKGRQSAYQPGKLKK